MAAHSDAAPIPRESDALTSRGARNTNGIDVARGVQAHEENPWL